MTVLLGSRLAPRVAMPNHSLSKPWRSARHARGTAHVEVLVIVGVVAALGLGAVKTLGEASSQQASEEAACIKSFACRGTGRASGTEDLVVMLGSPGGDGSQRSGGAPGSDETWAHQSKSFLSGAADVATGFFVDGLWGTVAGIGGAVMHPVETVEGLAYAVTHPRETASAIKEEISFAWHDNPQRFVGAGIFDVVTLPFAATKGTKVATAARFAREVEEVEVIAKASKATKLTGARSLFAKAFGPNVEVLEVSIAHDLGDLSLVDGGETYLYRGVTSDHPALRAARQGVATPGDIYGKTPPFAHNGVFDTASSPYTSWSWDPETAFKFANRHGEGGVVLRVRCTMPEDMTIYSELHKGPIAKSLPPLEGGNWVESPDKFGEWEVLHKGPLRGSEVFQGTR